MVSTKAVIVTLATAAGVLQMCPAPPAVVAAIAGGIAGGVVGGAATLCAKWCPNPNGKRAFDYMLYSRDLPPGISQHAIDECTQQLNDQKSNKGISVEISDVDEHTINVDNVPPACMNLATVLTGNPAQAGGPVPVPMGSSSLQYTEMTGQDRRNLADALGV